MGDDEVYEGRNAEILESIINDTEYTDPPQSRIEELLLELKEVIEAGGGGGGSATLSSLIEQVTGYPLNDYASMSLYSKDLNTITKSGFYNAMTCTNAPFDYMTLTVIGYYLQGYTVQIACDVTTGEVKKRNNINGTWSAWTTTKELPAVTTDDNDKVLMVKEGSWDKGNASGGSVTTEDIYTNPTPNTQQATFTLNDGTDLSDYKFLIFVWSKTDNENIINNTSIVIADVLTNITSGTYQNIYVVDNGVYVYYNTADGLTYNISWNNNNQWCINKVIGVKL